MDSQTRATVTIATASQCPQGNLSNRTGHTQTSVQENFLQMLQKPGGTLKQGSPPSGRLTKVWANHAQPSAACCPGAGGEAQDKHGTGQATSPKDTGDMPEPQKGY